MDVTGRPLDIILATRNRPGDLSRALTSLSHQSWTDFFAIVIDQSDDVSTNAATIAELADARFLHVPTSSRGKSKALNEAIRHHSEAPLVAFTDDDCEFPTTWLADVVASADRFPDAGIIYGQLEAIPHDENLDFVPTLLFDETKVFDRPLARSPGLIGMGADMAIRRSTFELVGLFDEDLGPGGVLFTGEEVELMYRASTAGITIVQEPSICVIHWGLRSRADGTADRVLAEGFFAAMAGHGKHLRRGQWRAAAVTVHETWMNLVAIVVAMGRFKRPFHLRHLWMLVSGFWAGLRRGPAWPQLDS